MTELLTRRCTMRPVSAGDAESLHELWTSPGVRRLLWDGEIIPFDQTRAAIEQSEALFRERRYGLWAAWLPDGPTLAGFAGLWLFRDPPEVELLYGVAEPLWGRGYAGELADAVVRYCFETLQMPAVRASTDGPNRASIRVLEKLGFAFAGRSQAGGLDTVFYELRRGAESASPQPGTSGPSAPA